VTERVRLLSKRRKDACENVNYEQFPKVLQTS
jgi:hypothetical protein